MHFFIFFFKKRDACFYGNWPDKNKKASLLLVFIMGAVSLLWGCSTFVRIINEPKIIERFPEATSVEDPVYYDFIAKYFYDRGDYRQAIFFYTILLNKYEEASAGNNRNYEKERDWTQYEIAFCYLQLKQYETAAPLFRRLRNASGIIGVQKLSADRLQEIDALKR